MTIETRLQRLEQEREEQSDTVRIYIPDNGRDSGFIPPCGVEQTGQIIIYLPGERLE